MVYFKLQGGRIVPQLRKMSVAQGKEKKKMQSPDSAINLGDLSKF